MSISLGIAIVCCNRPDRLPPLLAHLASFTPARDATVVIADNGSRTPLALTTCRPRRTRLIRSERNLGVEAFNLAVAATEAEAVLVLDDDARPDPASLASALAMIERDPAVGAVGLCPVQSSTGRHEWRPKAFARRWPLLGCANLVRRSAWSDAGGYEAGYFLYSNDTDLALKLLARGWDVCAHPDWYAMHDCATSFRRPNFWFELAPRNRAWTARRHAPGLVGLSLALGAWADTHRRASFRPGAHVRAIRSGFLGILTPPPPLAHPAGARALMRLARAGVARPDQTSAASQETEPIRRVRVVIPAHGRQGDVLALLNDLSAHHSAQLDVVVVDNASDPPLAIPEVVGTLRVRTERLDRNRGGAGGFRAGLASALEQSPAADAVWLLDSDARIRKPALKPLIATLDARPDLVAAGSALRDPVSGFVYEIGGLIDRVLGVLRPAADQNGPERATPPESPVVCDYLAACSLLVRARPAPGPFPDLFLLYDDVLWCHALRRSTGLGVAAVPSSIVDHPWRKASTWSRYFQSRNAMIALSSLGLPRRTRQARAAVEVAFAASMAAVGRDDLAELHLRGLADALGQRAHATDRSALPATPAFEVRPIADFPDVPGSSMIADPLLRAHLSPGSPWLGTSLGRLTIASDRSVAGRVADATRAAARRCFGVPSPRTVIAPLGSPLAWLHGDRWIAVVGDGWIDLRIDLRRNRWRVLRVLAMGSMLALRHGLGRAGWTPA